uniref:Mon2 C-terminal domain-containing protein n=1 Tax=Clytia hemisphaerica TaxID=252671 RepID=A0A7M5XIT9_9CNID
SDVITRLAFQSLQLVVTDYLPIIPCWCLQVLVEVVGKFGLQPNEINISLTAIGLLWNLSDFLYQNRSNLKRDLEEYKKRQPDLVKKEETAPQSPIHNIEFYPSLDSLVPPFDSAWMCLYGKLGELCVDPRPAVRKSAGQTLFSTISAHGGLLENQTWYMVLWKVLFPLLEKVRSTSSVAANFPPPSDNTVLPGNILIHHSRDTAEKQWTETCVLTLAGVARVSTRSHILKKLDEYPRAWALLLEIIESNALSKNSEVALNSLKSFQEIVDDLSANNKAPKSKDSTRDASAISFVADITDTEVGVGQMLGESGKTSVQTPWKMNTFCVLQKTLTARRKHVPSILHNRI